MKNSDHALEHLKVIRGMMEKATVYRALSAPAAIFGGFLAILIGYYFFAQDQKEIYLSGYHFFWTWVVALVVADSFNGFLLFRRARKEGINFLSAGLKHTCFACAPAAIAGGIISYEVVEQEVELCALVWTLCYGVAILAMGGAAPRSLRRLGWSFLTFGIIIFLVWMKYGPALSPGLGIHGPVGAAGIIMMLTFGLLHLIYGFSVLLRKGEKDPVS
ncbi:MAG: hypothetical protein VX646_06905 [Verrucomicrobiota bacterium]|nr:hypothetical protein [Verrucomicrobiota bacterium]MED5471531.1 hypothetical protein [Verrucomicrobiota bacterium]MEE2967592.1 hypothetical protein [Verrucomicrobiota bacterium]